MNADSRPKPRMLFFRWSTEKYAPFARANFDRIFDRGLSAHFDLVTVSEDSDYAAACDRHRPDIVLFESGNNGYNDPPLRIRNTNACPRIPKIGFLRSDAFCNSRTIFLSDMERWGVDTFFTYVTGAGEYFPEIADALFYWPFAVDDAVYRDHGVGKTIPILMLGNESRQYRWRTSVWPVIRGSFPCLSINHLGYDPAAACRALHGVPFSRLINASLIVPTGAGIDRSIVQKYLEVPASRACLVAEKIPVAEAFGFRDMETCVFVDEKDVVDKLDHLFAHPQVLERITDAGYRLVHARHTPANRTSIREWYELWKVRQPGERIVQTDLFSPLRLSAASSPVPGAHVISGGVDRLLLAKGDAHLLGGRTAEAEACYRECLEYVDYMPEPKLRLGIARLLLGDPEGALRWIVQPIQWVFRQNGLEPDPVEWAFFILALACAGNPGDALRYAEMFPALRREELDAARRLVSILGGRAASREGGPAAPSGGCRRSVHAVADLTGGRPRDFMRGILSACGRPIEELSRTAAGPAGTGGAHRCAASRES